MINGQSRETGNIGYTRRRKKKTTTQYVNNTMSKRNKMSTNNDIQNIRQKTVVWITCTPHKTNSARLQNKFLIKHYC